MEEGCTRMGITKFNKDFIYYSTFGHKIKSTNPKTFSNLLGFRKGASIVNIEKSKEAFSIMNRFVGVLFEKKKSQLLFVNFDQESNKLTLLCALRAIQPVLVDGWTSGIFTNAVSKNKIAVVFLLSSKKAYFVIEEATKLNIPVISLVDTDATLNNVSFPILMNDNSAQLNHLLTSVLSDIIIKTALNKHGLSYL
jgi:ribosomal protein S2